tara:strand:+ start:339 stop:851 length:513 start_codon:yes stop_codon:yes gene_type:complete
MKKILLSLFIISIVGCETKTVEVEKSAGIAALYPGDGGDAFVMASTEDAQMAADLILAFADKNVEAMKESFADTAVYWPPLGGKAITTPLSELENIVMALHEPYDSIKRTLWNAIPIKLEGAENSSVTVSFKEDRFYKDGTEESLRIIDRIFINSEKKIYRIHQWTAEME